LQQSFRCAFWGRKNVNNAENVTFMM
jgi:hypothetical protein